MKNLTLKKLMISLAMMVLVMGTFVACGNNSENSENTEKESELELLSEDELEDIDLSVDVLSTPTKAIKEELDPRVYGVIVSKDSRRGLLLPDLEGV